MKEYTVHVRFDMAALAENKEVAKTAVLSKLHFPGNVIANLEVSVRDLPADK